MTTIIPDEQPADDDARRLAEVRAILAAFDWETDDRQLALEAIKRIVALDDDQADEAEDDHWREAYTCSACGALIGVFIGHGDGWHHYRGEGTAASPVELFDAGHEATFALAGEPVKLTGCTCTPIRGSHKPPCPWAAGR